MSLETYLKYISSKLIVDSNENYKMIKSIEHFKGLMNLYFGNNIEKIKVF